MWPLVRGEWRYQRTNLMVYGFCMGALPVLFWVDFFRLELISPLRPLLGLYSLAPYLVVYFVCIAGFSEEGRATLWRGLPASRGDRQAALALLWLTPWPLAMLGAWGVLMFGPLYPGATLGLLWNWSGLCLLLVAGFQLAQALYQWLAVIYLLGIFWTFLDYPTFILIRSVMTNQSWNTALYDLAYGEGEGRVMRFFWAQGHYLGKSVEYEEVSLQALFDGFWLGLALHLLALFVGAAALYLFDRRRRS